MEEQLDGGAGQGEHCCLVKMGSITAYSNVDGIILVKRKKLTVLRHITNKCMRESPE